MAQTILIKRSNTASAVPSTSQLSLGELALNTRDGKIYMRKYVDGTTSNDTITLIGDTSTIAGSTFTGNLNLGDNVRAVFGSGNDLQIYHDGSQSIIQDVGTGQLKILGENTIHIGSATGSHSYIRAIKSGAVELYHNNVKKFETTASGVQIQGSLAATTAAYLPIIYGGASSLQLKSNTGELFAEFNNNGNAELYHDNVKKFETTSTGVIASGHITASGTNNIYVGDNGKFVAGANDDLQIYHTTTGNHSIIAESGSGNLILAADNLEINNAANNENKIVATSDGAVTLYHNNSPKLATTSTGIDVTGSVTADGLTVDGASSGRATLATFNNTTNAGGTEAALSLRNTATGNCDVSLVASRIGSNFGSDFYIETSNSTDGSNVKRLNIAEDGDISFYNDSAAQGLFWDSSASSLGIGTTSINSAVKLQVENTGSNAYIRIVETGNTGIDIGQETNGNGIINLRDSANLRMFTAGQERFVINSSGNASFSGAVSSTGATTVNTDSINIGFTAPNGEIKVKNSSASPAANLDFYTTNTSGTTSLVQRITYDGRVGIGNDTFAAGKLRVYDTAGNHIWLKGRVSDGNASVSFRNNADNAYNGRIATDDTSMNFQVNGSERMRIDSSGRLLVNSSSNTSRGGTNTRALIKLATGESYVDIQASSTSANSGLLFSDGSGGNYGLIDYAHASDAMLFYTAATERMRINSSGNVGIGTSAPQSLLHVSHATAPTFRLSRTGTGQVWIQSIDSSGRFHLTEKASEGGTGYTRLKIDDTGEITFNEAFTFPTTDGSANQLLKTDGSGNMSWVTVSGAGASSYIVDADGDTKIQVEESSDEDKIRFDANGVEIVRMGFNSSSESTLEVVRNGVPADRGQITFNGSGLITDVTSGYHSLIVRNAGSEHFRVRSNGNVGIGESSPGEKLQVNGNIRADGSFNIGGTIVVTSSRGFNSADGTASAPTHTFHSDQDTGMYRVAANTLGFTTGGTERMRINASNPYLFLGHTGHSWGTFGAVAQIGRTGFIANYDNGANQQTAIGNNTYHGGSGYTSIEASVGAAYLNFSAGNVRFFTAPATTAGAAQTFTNIVTFLNNGRVGIGTNAPDKALHIQSSSSEASRSLRLAYDSSYYFDLKQKGAGGIQYNAHNATSGGHRFDIDGSEKLRIAYSGNVGIGTTSPLNSLHIKYSSSSSHLMALETTYSTDRAGRGQLSWRDSSNITGAIWTEYDGSQVSMRFGNLYNSGYNTNSTMIIRGNGRVGIGTVSPAEKFHVDGNVRLSGSIVDSFGEQLNFQSNDLVQFGKHIRAEYGLWARGATARAMGIDGSNGYMGLYTNTTEKVRITSSGDVIIGATSAQDSAHFQHYQSAARHQSFQSTNGDLAIVTDNNTNPAVYIKGTGTADLVNIFDNTTEVFTILDGGNVGINRTSPSGLLHMQSPSGTDSALYIQTSAATDDSVIHFGDDGASSVGSILYDHSTNSMQFETNSSERMRIDSSGNLIIGKTATTFATQGAVINHNGTIDATRSGDAPLYLNRLASDGNIIALYKASVAVGSIGNIAGDNLFISGSAANHAGLNFGTNEYVPMAAGANTDNVTNIGSTSHRFHDAHFGGTVNVGENLVVTGNLTINGTTTTLNTATLNVEDKNITLNYGSGDTSSTADGAGITIQDAVNSTTDASLTWRASDDKFIFSHKLRMFNNLELPDNVKLVAGDSDDLQIYHNGLHSYIDDNGTGALFIRGSYLAFAGINGEQMINAEQNAAVELYHNNSKKFETTSTGVSITGKTTFSDDITVGHATTGTHSTTTTATTGTAIASFGKTSFRSAKYLVQVTNTTDSTYHVTEILIIHDGTDTYMTEYGSMFTGTAAEATFTSDISGGGSVRLLATPASTDSMTFKVIRQNITV